MRQWFGFFFGTPQRFLATVAVAAVIYGLFRPDVIGQMLHNLLAAILYAITPFLQPILTLAVIAAVAIWAFRRLTR